MRDGKTRKHLAPQAARGAKAFFDRYDVKVLLVSGPEAGSGFRVDKEKVILGRGPGVHRAFDDPAMSRQHAAIELAGAGLRLRDLGSTNGTVLNGVPVKVGDLSHGDRFEIGSHQFSLAIEERDPVAEVYELES